VAIILARAADASQTGGYYLLLQFSVSFGKRIPDMPLYALFLILLVVVFALRMIAMPPSAKSAVTAG
jgi:methionine sulfoxide reductase heme-binding subunit